MSKQFVSVVVGVVFASSAFGQVPGEVMSFYCPVGVGDCVLLDPVPPGGFVVTDISMVGQTASVSLFEGEELKAIEQLHVTTATGPLFLDQHRSYRAGIAFTTGTTMTVTKCPTNSVTISGYVPCPTPCRANLVPAVGSFGQAVLVLALVAAGSMLLRRRNDGSSRGTVTP